MFSRNGFLFRCLVPSSSVVSAVRHKGHSKWDNIKHTKMAKDTEKSKKIGKWIIQITNAVYLGGGNTNPVANGRLAETINRARKEEVPATTIERCLKRLAEREARPVTWEIIGPGGAYLVVDGLTENQSMFKTNVKAVMRQFKG